MRVKKIELIGFKSFADRTEIHLGEGVTCVVGPNGCGKSNISDAIRWVLGERSAKLLRGTRMDDVIFAGTEFRKPLGMAEVSITLDNSDHSLPIEYDEVVFSRRLYRSGQSEYFLNRTACRLKDILDLILDTGMGSNSYSMIEQGRVDAIIQADPETRRFLIEEAAGISKFKVKKEEALRKLERTEQNLLRIRDILGEVQKNIQYAERQARRAERYKVQYDELKKLEIQKAFLELGRIGDEKSSVEFRKTGLEKQIETLKTELQDLLKRRDEQQALFQSIVEEESRAAAHCFELRSEIRSVSEKQTFTAERTGELEKRKTEVEKENEILALDRVRLEEERRQKSAEREQSRREYEEAERTFAQADEKFSSADAWLREKKQALEEVRGLLFQNAAALVEHFNELNRQKVLLEANERNRSRRQEALLKFEEEERNLLKKHAAYQEELTAIGNAFRDKGSSEENLEHQLKTLKAESEALEGQWTEKNGRLQEAVSRLKLLEELDEKAEDMERKLLSSFSDGPLRGKIVRTLREVLKIEEGYETAIEAILGSFAQALIAEDVETAKDLIHKMTETHMGPCGILIRSLTKPNGRTGPAPFAHPRVHRLIGEVVTVQEGMESLFHPLFENVYVVEDFSPEDLHELLPLAAEVKLVTKQGVILGPEARIFFRNGRLSAHQGTFQREAEIRRLGEIVRSLERELEGLNTNKKDAEERILRIESDLSSLGEEGSDILIQKKATESLLQGLTDRLSRLKEEIRITRFEIEESAEEARETRSKIADHDEKIRGLKTEETSLQKAQQEASEALEKIQKEREGQIHQVTRLKTLLENFEERFNHAEKNETLLIQQVENIKNRVDRLVQEGEELKDRLDELSEEGVNLIQKKETLLSEQTTAEESLTALRGRKAYQEESLKAYTAQVSEKESSLKDLQASLHQEELKSMDTGYREKSVFERLDQSYHVRLAELNPQDFAVTEAEISEIEPRLQALKEKVEAFGPVNLLAVDEYEELKHRHDFLAAQEKDLNEARESLLEAIRKINRTTKTLFAETFAKAQQLFQEYYQILFNGGHAELILLEGEEHQEPGVDIMVRPPGKKLQHISLLSGGEKALTAMALLFALFKIKPSPMCVLDEVDAPLDEANVDRFIKVLRAFLGSTQFLIVTHNRKTIAMGDYLYGVTMEESGVSKLVSVKVGNSSSASQETPAPAEEKLANA